MIILIAGQKGGCGKSTIATNIAAALASDGSDVMLVDADRQITSSTWWSERKRSHPTLPKIQCVQKYDEIDSTLEDLADRYGYVVVDAAGHDSYEMRSALVVSDIVLSPFCPSQADLDTLTTMSMLVKKAKKLNPKMQAYSLINRAPTNPKVRDTQLAVEVMLEYPELTLLDAIIRDRGVYRDALGEGLGVIEKTGRSDSEVNSREEIKALIAEMLA
jgi:chromosome partitioning protein